MIAVLLCLAVMVFATLKPESAPIIEKSSWLERFKSLVYVLPILILVIIVLGSMYTGMATITEAAGVGATGAFLIALLMRRLSWPLMRKALMRTAYTSCMILFLVIGGLTFSFVVGYMNIQCFVTCSRMFS